MGRRYVQKNGGSKGRKASTVHSTIESRRNQRRIDLLNAELDRKYGLDTPQIEVVPLPKRTMKDFIVANGLFGQQQLVTA